MAEIQAPEGMVKVGEEYEITDSKDSTWQEWYTGSNYYLDQSNGSILAIDYDGFDNARDKSSNWEKETGRRILSVNQVPDKVRTLVQFLLSKKPSADNKQDERTGD